MDKRQQTIQKVIYCWEIGLLRFLYEKDVLSEEEYAGILKIVKEQQNEKFVSEMINLTDFSG